MGRALFARWLDGPHGAAAPHERGVHIDGRFASWASLADRAKELAPAVRPGEHYLVDPSAGHDAFAALLAVGKTPDTTLLWAKSQSVPFALEGRAPGLFAVSADPPGIASARAAYATVTSGTSGAPKIPVAYGDVLELVALQYDLTLYQTAFEGNPAVNVLATCLPLEYAAVFMMTIVPALFMARDLLVFPNHRWDILHAAAAREPVACLSVPALVAAASAATPEPVDMRKAALVFTAGYLSRSRSDVLRGKFRGVTLLGSYGASETGVMTLDRDPGANVHVGRPIAGKPVWIVEPDENGVGKIATTGPDCREHYWGKPERFRDENGVVASTDYGHFDEAGNLYLDGRLDGGQKLHGMLIYPRQIERHILTLPGVEDARVRLNAAGSIERLEAIVIGSATPEAVREHCRALPEACQPAIVECMPEGSNAYSARGKL